MEKIKISDIFEVHHAYTSEEIKAEEITMFTFSKKIISLMNKRSASHAYLSVHKTNLDDNPFSPKNPLSNIQNKENSYIFLEDIKESFFVTPALQENGTELRSVNVTSYIKGTYLIILVFSSDEEHAKNNAPTISTRIVNAIRLTHGIKSAGSSVYKCYFNKLKDEIHILSDSFTVYIPGDSPSADKSAFTNHGIKEIGSLPLSPDADILFNRAINETEPETRFLFLWLCFEAMVPSDRRRDLFEARLSSGISNSEVLRLFNLRCELTHEGRSKITALDCLSVLWAIRIAVCPEEDVQKKLTDEYEKWIVCNGWVLPGSSNSKRLEARFDKDHEVFKLMNDLRNKLGANNSTILESAIRELWVKTFR